MEQELLTVNQVATMLGVCRTTVYNMMNAGELRRVKLRGRLLRFSRKEILAKIEESSE